MKKTSLPERAVGRGVRGSRAFIVALTALLLFGQVGEGWAQEQQETWSSAGKRRFIYALVGAAVAIVPSLIVENQNREDGLCNTRSCAISTAGTMGFLVGYMIGREHDQAAFRRRALGPDLRMPSRAFSLGIMPRGLSPHDEGVVVVGQEGLAAVGRDGAVRLRGGQMRGIEAAAAFPGHDALIAVTPSGLFSFPLTGEATEGRLVGREGGASIERAGSDQLLVGGGELLRRLRLSGEGALLTATEEARIPLAGVSGDLEVEKMSEVVWSLSRDRLTARSLNQLEEIGSLTLPAAGVGVSISGERALIAGGNQGLFLVDISRPEAPALVGRIASVPYAYGGVLVGTTAYVAAGRAGLLVVDVSDPAKPRVQGVARDFGFVGDVAPAGPGELYVLDRDGRRVHVVSTQR